MPPTMGAVEFSLWLVAVPWQLGGTSMPASIAGVVTGIAIVGLCQQRGDAASSTRQMRPLGSVGLASSRRQRPVQRCQELLRGLVPDHAEGHLPALLVEEHDARGPNNENRCSIARCSGV